MPLDFDLLQCVVCDIRTFSIQYCILGWTETTANGRLPPEFPFNGRSVLKLRTFTHLKATQAPISPSQLSPSPSPSSNPFSSQTPLNHILISQLTSLSNLAMLLCRNEFCCHVWHRAAVLLADRINHSVIRIHSSAKHLVSSHFQSHNVFRLSHVAPDNSPAPPWRIVEFQHFLSPNQNADETLL